MSSKTNEYIKRGQTVKALFVYPNSAGYTRVPIGIALLVSCLKQSGHKVKVFDTSFYKLKEKTDDQIREQLGQVKETNLSEYGVKFQTKTEEEIFLELKKVIDSFVPDFVAFSVNEELVVHACRLAENIKEYSSIPIIFGGIGVTTSPAEIIEKSFIDMICIGEGEDAIVELANNMESGEDISLIKNLWVKRDGTIVKNNVRPLKNLNDLPFVDLDEFSDKHFFRPFDGKIYRMIMYEMMRGCSFRCSYCDNHVLQDIYKGKGKYVREKSIERTINELVYLKNRHNIELFFFIDDDICLLKEEEMGRFLKAYRDNVKTPFIVQGRVNTVTERIIKDLKKSNCISVCMSIESGSKDVRESIMNRYISNANIIKAFRMVKKIGLKVNSQNIIGNPDETRREIFETIEINRRCEPYTISTNFMTPFKGTKIRDLCVERGYIDPLFSVTTGIRGRPVLKLPQINDRELISIQKVFSLYVKLPKVVYPLIRYCESDGLCSNIIYRALMSWMWKRNDRIFNK